MKQEPVTIRMARLVHQMHKKMALSNPLLYGNAIDKDIRRIAVKAAADLKTNKLDAFQASSCLAIVLGIDKEHALGLICKAR